MKIEIPKYLIEEKYISVTKHPDYELYIYNYTANTQYEKKWNEYTEMCRGLILDKENNIVARPFKKFFNYEELDQNNIPKETFEIFAKLDGSLGILYWTEKGPQIATRGSFVSEQAIKATEILYLKYSHILSKLDKTKTYLFEILYPENRIVVNYGNKEDIVLLAIIDNETGKDIPLVDIGFPIVEKYDFKDYTNIQTLDWENSEGFVIKFSNDFRMKLKFKEYIRLHRILTQISNKDIWEYLQDDNTNLSNILERVPDEFYTWVTDTIDNLILEYNKILNYVNENYKVLDDRKTTALYFLTLKYNKLFFLKLDNKDYYKEVWKFIKPKYERPFSMKNENS